MNRMNIPAPGPAVLHDAAEAWHTALQITNGRINPPAGADSRTPSLPAHS